eukprot:gb/GEZN01014674.1/.p1 GENE.gb/GEZN01014674.1/~~gb/GEZN01014674.1/.p1  ORF type:complete len:151 (+),score=50.08 gb/GEZN01014674.1/:167-619(+)
MPGKRKKKKFTFEDLQKSGYKSVDLDGLKEADETKQPASKKQKTQGEVEKQEVKLSEAQLEEIKRKEQEKQDAETFASMIAQEKEKLYSKSKEKFAKKHGRDACIVKTTLADSATNDSFDDANIATYQNMMKKGMFRKADNFLDEMYSKS